jgi:hypothetical protein
MFNRLQVTVAVLSLCLQPCPLLHQELFRNPSQWLLTHRELK